MCTKDFAGPSDRYSSDSCLDHSTLLYSCTETVSGHSPNSEGFVIQPSPSNSGQASPSTVSSTTDGMQVIRQSLLECQIPSDIADVILCSWRDGTHKQYKVYLKQWTKFCSQASCDPVHPTVNGLLSFLHSLAQKGLSYSALNSARSAVSNIDINYSAVHNHIPVGKHPLVCRYLKGMFNKLKPVPKYHTIWPVDTVLDYLSMLWPIDKISLKELTLKLVMLIALTTGQRCQTLTFLDISTPYMQRNQDFYDFGLTEHIKQDRPGKVFGNVRLYKYGVKELCVSETLDCYINTTKGIRNSTKLLVSYIKPYKEVTSSTIGRWVKTALGQAGSDTGVFSAHSTRCASTSKALMSVSTDVILATAGWNEESTFRKFYNKPIAVTNQMSVSVLQ